jgi:peptidoglycan/xylan/chitin deacetylase (PgdA/CDA1 family)
MRHPDRRTSAAVVVTLVASFLGSCSNARDKAELPSVATTRSSPTVTTTMTTSPPTSEPSPTTTLPPVATTVAPPPGRAEVVRRGDPARPVVALTFDAGSDAGYTAQILDTLAVNGIRASFGLTGRWVERNPSLASRIASEGHHLLNHTFDHPSFTGRSTGEAALNAAARADQVVRADAAIQAATGRSTRPWFRPPYGDYDDSVVFDAAANGYGYLVLWTVDSLGWKGLPAAQIIDRCLENAVAGAIYLFHVGSSSQDGPALQAIIAGLRARGYLFATVAGLVGR